MDEILERETLTSSEYLKLKIAEYSKSNAKSIYYDLPLDIQYKVENERNLKQRLHRMHGNELLKDHEVLFALLNLLGITFEEVMTIGKKEGSKNLDQFALLSRKIDKLISEQKEIMTIIQRKAKNPRLFNWDKGNCFFWILQLITIASFRSTLFLWGTINSNLFLKFEDFLLVLKVRDMNCILSQPIKYKVSIVPSKYLNCFEQTIAKIENEKNDKFLHTFNSVYYFLLHNGKIKYNKLIASYYSNRKNLYKEDLPKNRKQHGEMDEVISILSLDFILLDLCYQFVSSYKNRDRELFNGNKSNISSSFQVDFLEQITLIRNNFKKYFIYLQKTGFIIVPQSIVIKDIVTYHYKLCYFLFSSFPNTIYEWMTVNRIENCMLENKIINEKKAFDSFEIYKRDEIIKLVEDTDIFFRDLSIKTAITKR